MIIIADVNYFSVFSETTTYISWTLLDGLNGTVTFTVDSELANLSLENITYNQDADLLTVDVFNSGGISAWDIGLSYYLTNSVSDECNNSNAEVVFSIPYLAAGSKIITRRAVRTELKRRSRNTIHQDAHDNLARRSRSNAQTRCCHEGSKWTQRQVAVCVFRRLSSGNRT